MAGIDYIGIADGAKTVIDANLTSSPAIEIERDAFDQIENPDGIAVIYLQNRVPADSQAIAAGLRSRQLITLQIICAQFSLDSVEQALRLAATLASNVEIALMQDRTLNGTCNSSWSGGGDFDSSQINEGFLGAVEVLWICDAQAIAP